MAARLGPIVAAKPVDTKRNRDPWFMFYLYTCHGTVPKFGAIPGEQNGAAARRKSGGFTVI